MHNPSYHRAETTGRRSPAASQIDPTAWYAICHGPPPGVRVRPHHSRRPTPGQTTRQEHLRPETARPTNTALECLLCRNAVLGEVISVGRDSFAIRFDLDGLPEEREFFWEDLSVSLSELTIGTKVIGRTELVKAPPEPSEEEEREKTRQLRDAELRKQTEAGGSGHAQINLRTITPEEQAETDRSWLGRMTAKPSPPPTIPGNAS
jgi:hypothetical protein